MKYIGGWVGLWRVRNISTRYSTQPTKLFVKPTQPDPSHLIDLHGLSWVGQLRRFIAQTYLESAKFFTYMAWIQSSYALDLSHVIIWSNTRELDPIFANFQPFWINGLSIITNRLPCS